MKIIIPKTAADWKQYYALRYEVLREPWNQPHGSEVLADEESALHAMIVDDNSVLAVARLHEAEKGVGQVRCVAVSANQQGKGLGKLLMQFLEQEAEKKGMREIILEARENAVPFYEKIGYRIINKSYLLFGEIQHYTMKKVMNYEL